MRTQWYVSPLLVSYHNLQHPTACSFHGARPLAQSLTVQTGSAHAYLAGYFNTPSIRSTLTAGQDPSTIVARQLSARGGKLLCRKDGTMVKITGQASIWASGTLRT